MLTVAVAIVAGLVPPIAVIGFVLWRRFIVRDEAAGAALGAVAIGLVTGVLMGGAITGVLVALALLIARSRR